jgi:hypothetical protein
LEKVDWDSGDEEKSHKTHNKSVSGVGSRKKKKKTIHPRGNIEDEWVDTDSTAPNSNKNKNNDKLLVP